MKTRDKLNPLGIWFVGARGSIATMTTVCAHLIAESIIEPVGMLTERHPYTTLPFCALNALRFGGCDIRSEPLTRTLDTFIADQILPSHLYTYAAAAVSETEAAIDFVPDLVGCIRTEELYNVSGEVLLDGLRSALAKFKASIGGNPVIVVNLASTEPIIPGEQQLASFESWEQLDTFIRQSNARLPWGFLYACAALLEDCSYINFTPNIGAEIPGLEDLALRRQLPHVGKDGKTGETLLKTALAPIFEARALRVRSWVGYNILGNSDGQSLTNPAARDAKTRSKDQQIRNILRDSPDVCTKVGIDFVSSLGDWKTAWDFVHFEGILGTKMSLQLLWQGADTILAAPLVLDLIRLVEFAWRRGETGALRHLGAFFKSPIGCTNHDFWFQMRELQEHLGIEERIGE
jgi:myo-inositol-1-phosphate synthase